MVPLEIKIKYTNTHFRIEKHYTFAETFAGRSDFVIPSFGCVRLHCRLVAMVASSTLVRGAPVGV